MLKFAAALAAMFVVAATAEAGNRCCCGTGWGGVPSAGYAPSAVYAPSTVYAPAPGGGDSTYRSYSYEPGMVAPQPYYAPASAYYAPYALGRRIEPSMNWRTTPSYNRGIR